MGKTNNPRSTNRYPLIIGKITRNILFQEIIRDNDNILFHIKKYLSDS